MTTRTACRSGVRLDLRPREFSPLKYLMLREGEVISKTEIEEHIYDELVSPMSNVVEAAVSNLRKNLTVNSNSRPLDPHQVRAGILSGCT